MTDMKKTGLKPPTINKNMRHLKAAFNKAVEWEYLEKPIRFPKSIPEEKINRYLTQEQLDMLAVQISKIKDKGFLDFCMLSAYTGTLS